MDSSKRNIAIVCGGDSSEHDVSLRSAQGLYSFFDKQKYNVFIVDVKGTDWHVHLDSGATAAIDKISRLNSMENQSFLIMPTLQSMANLVRMV